MVCLLLSRDGAVLLLQMAGMMAFSSAFLPQDTVRPLQRITTPGKRNHRVQPLHVLADLFDAVPTKETEPITRETDDSSKTKNILTFRSSFETQSSPLAPLSPDVSLEEFLLHPEYLTNAMKSVQSKIVPTTTDLLEDWNEACRAAGASPPSVETGVVMSVRTAGISIPGLSVEWSALIGTNLNAAKELEFVLIKDENKVSSGAKPIVWIFHKLSQSRGKTKKKGGSNMDTTLFTRLGFSNDDESESLLIRCQGTMEMNFRIPNFVAKLVFSSPGAAGAEISNAERKISNLITKQIEKDMGKTVLRWEENYRSWRSDTEQTTESD